MPKIDFSFATLMKFLGPLFYLISSLLSLLPLNLISKYHLPTSQAIPIISALLPALDYFTTTRSIKSLNRPNPRNRRSKRPLPPFLLFINLLGLLFPTVLSTLSTQLLTDNKCALKDIWQGWFSAHDAGHIKEMQGLLQCCGFGTYKEMPFPFPTNPGKDKVKNPGVPAETCKLALGADTACYPLWEGQLKTAGGVLVGVNVAMAVVKLVFLMIALTNSQKVFAKRGEYGDTGRFEEVDGDDDEEYREDVRGRITNGESGTHGATERADSKTRLLLPQSHGGSEGQTNGHEGRQQVQSRERQEEDTGEDPYRNNVWGS